MKIGIIGGGAMGMLLAFYLEENHSVTLYIRNRDQLGKLREKGITMKNNGIPHFPRFKMLEEVGKDDLLFICVKQYHLKILMPLLQGVSENVPVVFLQNGMGHLDLIKHLKTTVLVGVMEHGAIRVNENVVTHTGKGVIRLADFHGDKKAAEISTILNRDSFPFVFSKDYYSMLAEKLVINGVINPLTAIMEVENGQVISNPHFEKLAYELCREACMVLGLPAENAWKRVKEVASHTSVNQSSMLKDLQEKRPTEIDAISGYLLSSSKVQLPYQHFVYHAVKAKELIYGEEK
ncbi:2-dehydropantoate 2-reductase [Thalassobacillus pellis]|uniref:2-dehydropantoate 2-reductase n=1 Tax=Thalassobacillus pellis TaxID=748008 RepID=UPI0019620A32|nr:2-dehydropantoate 2-reductase [Thalassobacillus pellis]MBM7552863.1 2-dehydropantoate 2-reductase [Thalassobacillus pellis]